MNCKRAIKKQRIAEHNARYEAGGVRKDSIFTEEVRHVEVVEECTADNLIVGGRYNFQNQPERLVYLGREHSNGWWLQFAKVGSCVVWAEVRDSDLYMFEVTIERKHGE